MINQLSILLRQHNLTLPSLLPAVFSPIAKTTKLSGLSNQSYKLSFQDSQSPSVVIKFYQNLFPTFVNRKVEGKVLNILNKSALIPQIYSMGVWGYSYEFIQGQQLTHGDINRKTLHSVVDTMIDMTMIVQSTQEPQQPQQMRKFENVITNCKKISEQIQSKHPKKIQYNKILIQDMLKDDVVSNIIKILPEQTIFSHNDVNLTNLIKTKNGLMLMDYEFSCQNYIGYDLGNLLNEITTQYSNQFQIRSELEVDRNTKHEIISKYFQVLGRDPEHMIAQVQIGRLLSHHFWFFIGLLSFNDPECRLDLNYYLKRRHEQFFKYYKQLCLY